MQISNSFTDITSRAEAVGMSFAALCAASGVQYSTVRRWLRGDNSPNLRTVNAVLARLKDKLEQVEKERLQELQVRYGGNYGLDRILA